MAAYKNTVQERKTAIHKVGFNSVFCREAKCYLNSPSGDAEHRVSNSS